jgi:Protein of unknown function (DUF2934)
MTKEARWLDKELVARIAGRAYWLYEARGRRDGFDLQDWLQAEREISGSERSWNKFSLNGRRNTKSQRHQIDPFDSPMLTHDALTPGAT